MEKVYVVVTIYTAPDTQKRPGSKTTHSPIVHTYGPYTKVRAQYERQQLMTAAVYGGYSQHLTVKISQILDPEGKAQFIVTPISSHVANVVPFIGRAA